MVLGRIKSWKTTLKIRKGELKIVETKKAAEARLAQAKDEVEFTEAAALLEKQLAKLSILEKRKKKYRR